MTLWVLDEADRLLDLGFAEDLHAVRRLLVHPSPQPHRRLWCMMFSATWSPAVSSLAAAVLSPAHHGPLQINVGALPPCCFCLIFPALS